MAWKRGSRWVIDYLLTCPDDHWQYTAPRSSEGFEPPNLPYGVRTSSDAGPDLHLSGGAGRRGEEAELKEIDRRSEQKHHRARVPTSSPTQQLFICTYVLPVPSAQCLVQLLLLPLLYAGSVQQCCPFRRDNDAHPRCFVEPEKPVNEFWGYACRSY